MTLRPNDYDRNGDIIPDSVREDKGDLISREALKKEFKEAYAGITFSLIECNDLIDNAPTVDVKDEIAGAYNEGYMCGSKEAEKGRPQGEWFEYIDKGILKARHGDYVLYKVDFLLDNLAREVNIMEGARRMKGGAE